MAFGLVILVALGWVGLVTLRIGPSVGERFYGEVAERRAAELMAEDYECFYQDEDGDGEQDFFEPPDARAGRAIEPTTYCQPPTLIHHWQAVIIMVLLGQVLFAFAGTFTRRARGGSPWIGFTLGALLGPFGVVAAAVVPLSDRELGEPKRADGALRGPLIIAAAILLSVGGWIGYDAWSDARAEACEEWYEALDRFRAGQEALLGPEVAAILVDVAEKSGHFELGDQSHTRPDHCD